MIHIFAQTYFYVIPLADFNGSVHSDPGTIVINPVRTVEVGNIDIPVYAVNLHMVP